MRASRGRGWAAAAGRGRGGWAGARANLPQLGTIRGSKLSDKSERVTGVAPIELTPYRGATDEHTLPERIHGQDCGGAGVEGQSPSMRPDRRGREMTSPHQGATAIEFRGKPSLARFKSVGRAGYGASRDACDEDVAERVRGHRVHELVSVATELEGANEGEAAAAARVE